MSESRRITLETQVDTTGARAGFNEITREAGTMANAVRETSQRAQAGVSSIGDGASSSSQKVAAAERNLVGSIQRQAAAMQAGSRSSADYYETLGKQRGVDPAVLEPYLAQLREVEAAQARTKAAIGSATPEMKEFGVSTAQTNAALSQLPAQVSDIVSSLAGGQSPFLVLIQQGGQIKDSFGGVEETLTGIGGAIKGLFSTTESSAGAINAVSGALSGLAGSQKAANDGAQQLTEGTQQVVEGVNGAADSVNSLAEASDTAKQAFAGLQSMNGTQVFSVGLASAAAAAAALVLVLGTLAYAYNKGSNEAKEYARALILTGNAAGASAEQLSEAARQIGASTGNRGTAAAALVELTATGQVSIDNMRRFGAVAVGVEQIIGRAVSETAGDFAELGEAPLTALNKINDKYHFITAATYAQVKALQEQGRASEAASLAQNAYADGIDRQRQKVLDTLSDWERGWLRIKNGASNALDSVIDFAMGRGKTDFEKINGLLKEQADLEEGQRRARQRGLTADVASYQAQIDAKTREINVIRDRNAAEKEGAKAAADKAQKEALLIKYEGESNILLSRRKQLEQALEAADTEGKENNLTAKQIADRKAVIQRQFDDVAVQGIERQISAIQRLNAVEDARSQRRLLQINAARAAGDLTEDAAIKKTAAEEIAALDRHMAEKRQELSKVSGRAGSESEQDSISGEISGLREQRLTRQTQLEIDLAAAQRQRAADSYALETAGLVSAQAERQGLQDSVKAQREYNEEIGLTSNEVLSLRIHRAEALAMLKDESAAAQDAIEPGSALAATYRDQAQAIRDRYMEEREGAAKQKDPWTNLTLSLKQYRDEANDAGASIGDSMTSAFRSAEDAFAGFVTTGKLTFSSLATSIVADLARIAAKKAIAGLVGSALGAATDSGGWLGTAASFLSGARANGGPVNGGASYLVGERGPEIFTPASTGSITPNHMLGSVGGDGGVTITLVTNVEGGNASTQASGDTSAQSRAAADALNAKMKQVVMQESKQGGIIWNLTQGRG
jgi:lambda family phage tail tape measure protein